MGNCGGKKPNNNSNTGKINLNMEKPTFKDDNKTIESKVVLLGDQNVGKSSIAQRFCKNIFSDQYIVTIGGAYLQQKLVLNNGSIVKFHLWDTGGQERFRSMLNLYYQDASAAILTYDVTNEKSFDSITFWINELKNKLDPEKIVICLAGNKCDSNQDERKVSFNKAKQLAETHDLLHFETSAKNDIGIKEMFMALGKKIYDKKMSNQNN